MYEDKLQQLGLTKGEARVYAALLKIGSSTVGPVVKESKLAYSKIYEVLDRLIEKGFVSFIIKEKTKYFQALEPSRIEDFLNRKERELKEKRIVLNDLIPSLNTLKLKEDRQEAEIFIGEKGIITAYDLLLNSAKEKSTLRFFYMHDKDYDSKVFDFYYGKTNYNNRRLVPILKKKKIIWIGIVNKENLGKALPKPPRNIKQIYTKIPVPGNIDITDQAILITSWSDKPMGILIKSKEVSKNFQKYFNSIWKIERK